MVYTIGLIFVIIIISISIDDLIWDIYYFVGRILGKIKKPTIDAEEIEKTLPKMLAVVVAAYNEEAVLKDVIENLILSNQYPRSMYHIFLGVYPNDIGTTQIAKELEDKYDNVHMIVHVINGPSSKADNINNVIKNIFEFEKKNYMRFQGIVIHDSEDLVHPYEFVLENYLLQYHSAIQMPVFPLQEMPKLSNLFKNMVSGTYADEFAENHYRLLTARTSTGSFVPSAGTGFVLSRDLLDKFEDHNILPVGSLTEDYKLSLQLKQMGVSLHYVLESVTRLRSDGTVAREYISTRSMFPATYKAAVRQKTRWIYGITIQTFKLREIIKNKNLNFISKYSLYKDWKAKIGNLLLGPGYIIFAYFILSLFYDLPTMYPRYTLSWYLMVFLSIMMIERQILRAISVKNVYGNKSAIISVFFPPLLPFRMLLGNIINFHSTLNAWRIAILGQGRKKDKRKPAWNKTDHEFLEEKVLKRFRRNLGDTLMRKGLITSENLNKALNISIENKERLGTTIKNLGLVSEEDIVKSICEIEQKTYVQLTPEMISNKYISRFGKLMLKDLKVVPLLVTSKETILVAPIDVDENKIRSILNEKKLTFVYATESNILSCLDISEKSEEVANKISLIENYLNEDLININQALIALYYTSNDESIESTLISMGLLKYVEGITEYSL